MTYNDLRTEVAALGFESEIEAGAALLTATRRAIRTIFTEQDVRGVFETYQSARLPSIIIPDFLHTGGVIDEFEAVGKSCSFKTFGEGSYIIDDALGERKVDFEGGVKAHREHLHGQSRVKFSGDYNYSVFDFAVFDSLYGSSILDVPVISSQTEYDLKLLADRYLSPLAPPTDGYGQVIPGASAVGTVMKIPSSYIGKIRLSYKKTPVLPSGNPDEELVLPDGCEHLLPLLAAAYIWLDDDEEKASYYMSLYREGMTARKLYIRGSADISYRDTNGWA